MALYLIVAWRIHHITMAGRADPDAPCDVVFEPREWHTMYPTPHHRPPPQTPPSLREMVRGLAQLGGFLARTGDGEPGITSIWQGYQRLHAFIYAVEIHRTVNALQTCIMVSARRQLLPEAGALAEAVGSQLHALVRHVVPRPLGLPLMLTGPSGGGMPPGNRP
jgi:hypothetical protein